MTKKNTSSKVALSTPRGGKPVDRDNMSGGAAVVRSGSEARTPDRRDEAAGAMPISQGPTPGPKLVGQCLGHGVYQGAGSAHTPTDEEVRSAASALPSFMKSPAQAPDDLQDAVGGARDEGFPLAALKGGQ
jgi:hypothetical protein